MPRRLGPAVATAGAVAMCTGILAGYLTSCAAQPPTTRAPTPPPTTAALDYQLGGAYEPPAEVAVIVRDRTAAPDPTRYSICYVNAFQTQPGKRADWPAELLLHRADGSLVFDPDWPDEAVVDTSNTTAAAAIIAPWITACAQAGFDAVEFDNLDSYTRSSGALTRADNLALATLLVEHAHAAGLAAGQKNAAEDAAPLHEAGFDFAIAEECSVYDECAAYTAVYGKRVLAIEYPDALRSPFTEVCADPDQPTATVLRDRNLVTPDDAGYVFELCP